MKAVALLEMIFVTLLPALEAQKLSVLPEVTGYVGQDVTLPCHFIKSPNNTITQVQWSLRGEGHDTTIVVSNSHRGVSIPESHLKGRVAITEQSLIIRDVNMEDEGSYTCTISAFPSGSFTDKTILTVREQMPLSSGLVSAVAIAAILLVGIVAAITYFIVIRRCDSSVRHDVFISETTNAEDVVYSDVKFNPPRNGTTRKNDEHRKAVNADVTYADVMILGPRPK